MAWPQATDYNAAVQNPAASFSDPDLRQGQAACDLLGLPRPHAGNFADVYQVTCPSGQSWAVKCFTREVRGLQSRYQAISEHLRQTHRAFMVDFHYLEQGIRINGQWYPILKMRWVEGFRLNEFVAEQLDRPHLLEKLAQMWVKLSLELREARMAHGDLQHGNVLLVPGSKSSSLALRLIDYDGLFVPALAQQPSGEVGHPNYQHPQRLREGVYNSEVDRFAHLVIYTALRCLAVAGKSLWEKHDNQENLLFREADFRDPENSPLLRELWSQGSADTRALVGHVVLASLQAIEQVPLLEELVSGRGVKPLSGAEQDRLNGLFQVGSQPGKSPLASGAASGRRYGAGKDEQASKPDWIPEQTFLGPLPSPLQSSPANGDAEAPPLPAPALAPVPVLEVQPAVAAPVMEAPVKPEASGSARKLVKARPPLPIPAALPALPTTKTRPPLLVILSDFLLSRPWVLPVAGGGLLVLVFLFTLLLWPSRKGPAEPGGPTPGSGVPQLLTLADVDMMGGDLRLIPIEVERNGCEETLQVKVERLPGRVQAAPLLLPAPQATGRIELKADLEAESPPRPVSVSLWQQERKLAEQRITLTVQKRPLPSLRALESLVLQAGESKFLNYTLDRRGNQDEIQVKLEDLPEKVWQRPVISSPDEEDAPIPVGADEDAPPVVSKIARLTLWINNQKVYQQPVPITVEKPLPTPRLTVTAGATVKVGTPLKLRIEVARNGYNGPIDIVFEGLPAGVKSAPVKVAADEDLTLAELDIPDDTVPGPVTFRVVGQIGERRLEEQEVKLTIEKPGAVNPAPNPRRATQERVEFPTVDGVTLRGTYYPGPDGKKSNTVLLLHDLGPQGSENGWHDLALALQGQGLAVLSFDFRGHGGSRTVGAEFWKFAHNLPLRKTPGIRPGKGPRQDTLLLQNFPVNYQPHLVDDIAAARQFLEGKNDRGELNSSNLILIGAGKGATLGTLWLASEWHRLPIANVFDLVRGQPPPKAEPEGKAIIGAVWLSLDPTLGGKAVPVNDWLNLAGRTNKVPMLFLSGQNDVAGSRVSQAFALKAKNADGKLTLHQVIGGTAATGMALLQANLPTQEEVLKYVQDAYQQDLKDWSVHNTEARAYQWQFTPGTPIPAKGAGLPQILPVPVDRLGVH